MSRRVDRHGRVTQEAIVLFKLALRLESEGLSKDSEEYSRCPWPCTKNWDSGAET
jgi:hypothetical protein